MTDEQIVAAIKSDSEVIRNRALIYVQETCYRQAKRVIRKGLPEEVFDQLFAESLGDLWENIAIKESFRSDSSICTYLISIVGNKYRTYIRQKLSEKENNSELDEDIPSPVEKDDSEVTSYEIVALILETTSADCRRLLIMRYIDEMGIASIATQLNQSYDAVSKRISRCRKKIYVQYTDLISGLNNEE